MEYQNVGKENDKLKAKVKELQKMINDYTNEIEDSSNGVICIFLYNYSIKKKYNTIRRRNE